MSKCKLHVHSDGGEGAKLIEIYAVSQLPVHTCILELRSDTAVVAFRSKHRLNADCAAD